MMHCLLLGKRSSTLHAQAAVGVQKHGGLGPAHCVSTVLPKLTGYAAAGGHAQPTRLGSDKVGPLNLHARCR